MKKLVLLTFALSFSVFVLVQTFFHGYEIVPYFYKDDVAYARAEWKQLFEPPGKPQSPNFDSLKSTSRHPDRPGNFGMQVRVYRQLLQFNSKLHRWNLEWHTGTGYRGFKTSPARYSSYGMFVDTNQVSIHETESFEIKYHYLDLYSSITLKNADGPLHVFIGFGLQGSLPLGQAEIKEFYSNTSHQWNSSTQRWEQLNKASGYYTSNANKTYVFSFTIPLGFSVDLGDKSELKINGEYFNARRNPRVGDKYSEGVMLQLGFRYGLH